MRRPHRLHRAKAQHEHIIDADNCGACGGEHPLDELVLYNFAGWNLLLCNGCVSNSPDEDYAAIVVATSAPEKNFKLAVQILSNAGLIDGPV